MDWSAQGFVISVRPHGETSAIVNVFTREQGRHAGLVRGGRSRRMRPILQAGNRVHIDWQARLSEHLGHFVIEAVDARAAIIMQDRRALAALNSISALLMEALPEREVHHGLFQVYEILLDNMDDEAVWPALYVRFEVALLQALGYGLDLDSCAATGSKDNLTHVSPRSGRAVCEEAAQPYIDKLYRLPGFLNGNAQINDTDIADGLSLSGYFLESRIFHAMNKPMPDARIRFVEELS